MPARRTLGALALVVACGATGSGEVAFDGTTCTYRGPANFDSGEPVVIEFRNESAAPASLLTFRIAAGSDLEEIAAAAAESGASALLGGGQMDIPSAHRMDVAAGNAERSERSMEPGPYAVTCLIEADDQLSVAGRITVEAS